MSVSKFIKHHPDLGMGVDVNGMAREAKEFKTRANTLEKLMLEAAYNEEYYRKEKEHYQQKLKEHWNN